MGLLSQVLKDLADDSRMQPVMFATVWQRILEVLKHKRLLDKGQEERIP